MRAVIMVVALTLSVVSIAQERSLSSVEEEILLKIKKMDINSRAGANKDEAAFELLINKFSAEFLKDSDKWTKEEFVKRCEDAYALRERFELAKIVSERVFFKLRPTLLLIATRAETMDQFVTVLAFFAKRQEATRIQFESEGEWGDGKARVISPGDRHYYPVNLSGYLCQEIAAKRHSVDKFVKGGNRLLEKLEEAGIDKSITGAVRKVVTDIKEIDKKN